MNHNICSDSDEIFKNMFEQKNSNYRILEKSYRLHVLSSK